SARERPGVPGLRSSALLPRTWCDELKPNTLEKLQMNTGSGRSEFRKTKIVATVGPASRSVARLEELIRAGVNVRRMTFSHGSHDEHFAALNEIREAAAKVGQPVAILQDLSGPKIRISPVVGGAVPLADNAEITLIPADGAESDAQCIRVEAVN